jgi:hypothetical protein
MPRAPAASPPPGARSRGFGRALVWRAATAAPALLTVFHSSRLVRRSSRVPGGGGGPPDRERRGAVPAPSPGAASAWAAGYPRLPRTPDADAAVTGRARRQSGAPRRPVGAGRGRLGRACGRPGDSRRRRGRGGRVGPVGPRPVGRPSSGRGTGSGHRSCTRFHTRGRPRPARCADGRRARKAPVRHATEPRAGPERRWRGGRTCAAARPGPGGATNPSPPRRRARRPSRCPRRWADAPFPPVPRGAEGCARSGAAHPGRPVKGP